MGGGNDEQALDERAGRGAPSYITRVYLRLIISCVCIKIVQIRQLQ